MKLLHAHYAGAVPIDLLKGEQARIRREIEDAERVVTAVRSDCCSSAGADLLPQAGGLEGLVTV